MDVIDYVEMNKLYHETHKVVAALREDGVTIFTKHKKPFLLMRKLTQQEVDYYTDMSSHLHLAKLSDAELEEELKRRKQRVESPEPQAQSISNEKPKISHISPKNIPNKRAQEFNRKAHEIPEKVKAAIDRFPHQYQKMLQEYDAIQVATNLLQKDPTDTYTALYEKGAVECTVEYIVVEYSDLFDEEIVCEAISRLGSYTNKGNLRIWTRRFLEKHQCPQHKGSY